MTRRIKLHEIAHARAGDKGNTSNISVWVYDPGDYPLLKEQLTADRIKAAYPDLIQGPIKRYALDHLHGLVAGLGAQGADKWLLVDQSPQAFSPNTSQGMLDLDGAAETDDGFGRIRPAYPLPALAELPLVA